MIFYMVKWLFIFLLFPLISFSQQHWDLKKDKDGIQVYLREIAGSPFKQVKVKFDCISTLEKYEHIILDVNNHREWVYNSNVLKLLKSINEHELLYYTEFEVPWPVQNRDVVTHLRLVKDSIPQTLFVKSYAVTGYIPENEGMVRIISANSFWTVKRKNEKKISVEYIITVDPAGNLPPWLVNLTATKGPFNSFSTLKEILER